MSVSFELDPERAGRLAAAAGLRGRVDSVARLDGGIISAVFALRIGDRHVVVKLYPDAAQPRMRKEVALYALLASRAPGLRVPGVLAADDSRALVPRSYVILMRLAGTSLRSLLPRLTADDLRSVYREVGATLRCLHGVELDEYGEIGGGTDARYRTNRAFMSARLEAALGGFERLGGDPVLHRRLGERFESAAVLFDACERPVFCHNDGHDANVVVDRSSTGWSFSGLLDFELALAGDPLLDLAKSHYFTANRSEQTLAALVDGYGRLRDDWRAAFDAYVLFHQLELWTLLASLGVIDRLPAIAAELDVGLRR